MEETDLIDEIEIRETYDGFPTAASGADTAAKSVDAPDAVSASDAVRVEKNVKKSEAVKTAALAKKRNRPDPYIWGIYICLLGISIVELYSASSTEVSGANVYGPLIRHGIFLLMGFGIVLWLQKTPYTLLNKFSLLFAVVSLGLLLLSSAIGVEMNGAQRAISFHGITIQPAEISKLAVVVLLASILGRNQTPGGVTNRGVFWSALVVVVFGGCLWRNGLTNTLLLMCVSICMMVIGGIQLKKFSIVIAVYAVAGLALYSMKYTSDGTSAYDNEVARQEQLAKAGEAGGVTIGDSKTKGIDRTGTQKGRIKRFFEGVSPTDPITDENRQVMFAKFSQANGGMFGQGPGNSRESARLPLAFSDYIYSIIVEDTGFLGGAIILLLFLLLLARAGRIAYKCSRAFPAFLIMGCAVMIVFQALVHMAIVTGIFPVSGQPLPFISKGGTSVIVMSAALGVMLSVARFAAHSGDKKQIRAEINALPEDMKAANYSASK